MVDTIGLANAVGSNPTYTGRQARQLNAIAFAGATAARPLGSLTGVRPGTSSTTVTATSSTWTCGDFSGLADLMVANEAGPYPFAFDAVATGSMTPADSSNPRVDIVYVQVIDPEDGATVPTATRGYLAGAAASTPSAPAAPTGAFVIAQINVPKVGTGSPSVTWVAPTIAAAGGIATYPTKAALPGSGSLGTVVLVDADPTTANNRLWYGTGSGWTHSLNGSTPFAMAAGVGSNSAGASASITFPVGRFTQPPLVTMANTGATVSALNAASITTTGATMAGYSAAGAAIATNFMWVAVQMTPTSAAG
jgi:hypothetical protein